MHTTRSWPTNNMNIVLASTYIINESILNIMHLWVRTPLMVIFTSAEEVLKSQSFVFPSASDNSNNVIYSGHAV